jgi:hypothetical protein
MGIIGDHLRRHWLSKLETPPKMRLPYRNHLLCNLNKTIPAVLLLVASLSSYSFGQVIVSGDFGAGTGQIQISQDITFTISTNVTIGSLIIVFDEWAGTSDGGQTTPFLNESGILISINGAANTTLTMPSSLSDLRNGPSPGVIATELRQCGFEP